MWMSVPFDRQKTETAKPLRHYTERQCPLAGYYRRRYNDLTDDDDDDDDNDHDDERTAMSYDDDDDVFNQLASVAVN